MEAEWTRERAFLVSAATDGRIAAKQGAILVRNPDELVQWLGGPFVGEPAQAEPRLDLLLGNLHERVLAIEAKLASLHDPAYLAAVVQPPRIPTGPAPIPAASQVSVWPTPLPIAPQPVAPTRAWRDLFLANEQRR